MSSNRQWLDLGLDALPPLRAERVRLFRTLVATATSLRNRLDRELAPSGITTQQAALLQFIQSEPAPPTLTRVAQATGMTHQNAKQIVVALERKGFLEIVPDPSDGRARRLVLTAHHHRYWRDRNPHDFARVEDWTAALTDAEVKTLVKLLGKLAPAD